MSQKKTTKKRKSDRIPDETPQFPLEEAFPVVSLTEEGLREFLLKLRSGEKWIADLAPKLGVSPQMLGDVIAGKRGFGPKLLRGLGVVRTYQMYDVGPKWIEFDEQ